MYRDRGSKVQTEYDPKPRLAWQNGWRDAAARWLSSCNLRSPTAPGQSRTPHSSPDTHENWQTGTQKPACLIGNNHTYMNYDMYVCMYVCMYACIALHCIALHCIVLYCMYVYNCIYYIKDKQTFIFGFCRPVLWLSLVSPEPKIPCRKGGRLYGLARSGIYKVSGQNLFPNWKSSLFRGLFIYIAKSSCVHLHNKKPSLTCKYIYVDDVPI